MDGRRDLTDTDILRISNDFILPFLNQPTRVDNYVFLAALQENYGKTNYTKRKLHVEKFETTDLATKDAHAKKLGLLYLDKEVQHQAFPGTSSATIQTFIREFIFHTALPQNCQEFLLQRVQETLLNKHTSLFYALGDLVELGVRVGPREFTRFGNVNTKALLESFAPGTEATLPLHSTLYQALEAAQCSFTYRDGRHFMRSIWIVGYDQTPEWEYKTTVIRPGQYGDAYANNERLVELRYAAVNYARLTPLKGFVLYNEDEFDDILCLGKVERGVIQAYAHNPQNFRVIETQRKSSGCGIS